MFRSRHPALLMALLATAEAFGQAAKTTASSDLAPSAQKAIKLAQTGHCEEAVPALKRASLRLADQALKRSAAFAGVRCTMLLNQADTAVDFLRLLNRQFPNDPEVLYLSVHTYSDLSTRAAQQL